MEASIWTFVNNLSFKCSFLPPVLFVFEPLASTKTKGDER